MIRFCDREVYCVAYESLDRGRLLSYFLGGGEIRKAETCPRSYAFWTKSRDILEKLPMHLCFRPKMS